MIEDEEGPPDSLFLYHRLLVATISEGLDEWVATAHPGERETVYTHPERVFGFFPFVQPTELVKWFVGRDEAGHEIYIYNDGSISMVTDGFKRGLLRGRVVIQRKRYPLISQRIPMTPRVHRTLRRVGAAIAAPLPQSLLGSL